MKPSPCGFYGDTQKPFTCAQVLVTKYWKRISGPLLDRIDIHIEAPRVDYERFSRDRVGESFDTFSKPVQTSPDVRNQSFSKNGSSDMGVGEIRQFCKVSEEGQPLMWAGVLPRITRLFAMPDDHHQLGILLAGLRRIYRFRMGFTEIGLHWVSA
jgi:magnesium chelatase family protein